MILTGKEIIKAYLKGDIIINPFSTNQINPNSYNYKLGDQIKEFIGIDKFNKPIFKTHQIPKKGFLLNPHQMYLGSTNEIIGSDKYVISLIGRSSLGRLGLFLQLSANIGNIGTNHKWTLEIVSTNPFMIYRNMIIGQVSFWESKGAINLYQGIYSNFNTPEESHYKF